MLPPAGGHLNCIGGFAVNFCRCLLVCTAALMQTHEYVRQSANFSAHEGYLAWVLKRIGILLIHKEITEILTNRIYFVHPKTFNKSLNKLLYKDTLCTVHITDGTMPFRVVGTRGNVHL